MSGPAASATGGFPDPPQGSPGELRAGARSLATAGQHLDDVASRLNAASGALDADWNGYAAATYQASVRGLIGIVRNAATTFRSCARATAGYAGALDDVRQELRHLHALYVAAKSREAAAATHAASLMGQLAGATHREAEGLRAEMARSGRQQQSGADAASGYLARANARLDLFRHEARRFERVLDGERVDRAHPFGAAAPPFGSVSGVGSGIPGVWGGAAFGIPGGGLAPYDGTIPIGDPWNSDVPGFGTYMDAHTPEAEPVDDLTDAVLIATGLGGIARDALAVAARRIAASGAQRLGIGAAGRKAVQDAGDAAYGRTFSDTAGRGLSYRVRMRAAAQARDRAIAEAKVAQGDVRGAVLSRAFDIADRAGKLPPGVKDIGSELAQRGSQYRLYAYSRLLTLASRGGTVGRAAQRVIDLIVDGARR